MSSMFVVCLALICLVFIFFSGYSTNPLDAVSLLLHLLVVPLVFLRFPPILGIVKKERVAFATVCVV